jgi:hypothetical protein
LEVIKAEKEEFERKALDYWRKAKVADRSDPKQGEGLHLLEEYAADVATVMARTEMKVGEHLENAEALMVWRLAKAGVDSEWKEGKVFDKE